MMQYSEFRLHHHRIANRPNKTKRLNKPRALIRHESHAVLIVVTSQLSPSSPEDFPNPRSSELIRELKMAFAGKLGSLLKQCVRSNSSSVQSPMTSLMMSQVRCMSSVKKLIGGKSPGRSGGRNESGRVTAWHRGGGAKRLHRVIDMKRSIAARGVVERVEYDPYRSADIALVKWEEGVEQPTQGRSNARKSVKATANSTGRLSLSSSVYVKPSMDNYVVIGRPNSSLPFWERSITTEGDVKARVRDILFSTLTPRHNTRRLTKKEKKRTNSISFSNSLARLAGAEPAFFKRMRDGKC